MSTPYNLSVVIPARSDRGHTLGNLEPTRRAQTERAVECVLSQNDPAGTEVIVVDDGSTDRVAEHLKDCFRDAVASKKLRIHVISRTWSQPKLLNAGAWVATGRFITFYDPSDRWYPGRLVALENLFSGSDWIASAREPLGNRADLLSSLISKNWVLPGSSVIRRALFDKVGGVPEGLSVVPEYGLALKLATALDRANKLTRFKIMSSTSIAHDPVRPPVALDAPHWLSSRAAILSEALVRTRETATLLRLLPLFPPRYWPEIAARVGTEAGLSKRFKKRIR